MLQGMGIGMNGPDIEEVSLSSLALVRADASFDFPFLSPSFN